MPDVPSVAFIGLGNMGVPMAARLLAAGYDVIGFDRSETASASFQSLGGAVARSAAEAASGRDVVILMLPNSDVVDLIAAEVRPYLTPGQTLIDMGSSEPARTRALARSLAESELVLLDAPVSGGVRSAETGALTIMVGGDSHARPGVDALLAQLGRTRDVGLVGSGHAIKALNNLLSAAHFWLTSEVVAIGSRLGIEPEVLLDVVNASSGRSGSSEAKWPRFVLPGTFDSGFEAALMLKDVKIAVQLAEDLALPTELGGRLAELWQEALQSLAPHADHTEIAKVIMGRVSPLAGLTT